MIITVQVFSPQKEGIKDAIVNLISENRETQITLIYDDSTECYKLPNAFDSLNGVWMVQINYSGFEPLEMSFNIDSVDLSIRLGNPGSSYARFGRTIKPLKKYEGLIAVTLNHPDALKELEDYGLIRLDQYGSYSLKKNLVYQLSDSFYNNDGKENETAIAELWKKIRENIRIVSAGVVSSIGNSIRIFSGQIELETDERGIQPKQLSVLNNLGLALTDKMSATKYIATPKTPIGFSLFELIEDLNKEGVFRSIGPEMIHFDNPDMIPGNFLWGGQYVDKIIGTENAWQLLKIKYGTTIDELGYGAGDILVCVSDNGLVPFVDSGTPTLNPSFTGNVRHFDNTSQPKIKLLQDFRSTTFGNTNDTGVIDDSVIDDHGVAVCGIISAGALEYPTLSIGTAGIAPNTSLMSLIAQSINEAIRIKAYSWAAGLSTETFSTNINSIAGTATLPQLESGFDVFASSIAHSHTSTYAPSTGVTDEFGKLVDRMLLYGRNGRGVLMVFSAGNENSVVGYTAPDSVNTSVSNRLSNYLGVLSIGATSFYPTYNGERKAIYSNTGKIDFCAPSNNSGGVYGRHNPTENIGTWTTAFVTKGNLPGAESTTPKNLLQPVEETNPILESGCVVTAIYPGTLTEASTTITAAISAGNTTISIASGTNFQAGMWIEINGTTDVEYVLVTVVGSNLLTINPLTPIIHNYSIAGTAIKGLATIQVTDSSNYSTTQNIHLEVNAQGMTIIEQSATIEIAEHNFLGLSNISTHLIKQGYPAKIRKGVSLTAAKESTTTIPANYNPSTMLSASSIAGQTTLSVADSSGFIADTFILLETIGGQNEWVKIDGVTTNQLSVSSFTPLLHPHDSTTTTIKGYAAYYTLNSKMVQTDDWLYVIQGTNKTTAKVLHVTTDETIALDPLPFAVTTATLVLDRFSPVFLDNVTDLALDDIVLLGKPEFDQTLLKENSEIFKIKFIRSDLNQIVPDRIRHHHPIIPSRKLYKGSLDYKSSFGGTSSASPTVAGVIALILSGNPDLTWREIIEILKDSSEKIDVYCKGYQDPADDITGIETEGDLMTYLASVDNIKRPMGQGRWKNKDLQYIYDLDGVTVASGVTDTTPYFSEWYGYGRINAEEAVNRAINYTQNHRDLVIRDTLSDTGTTANPANIEVNSPDIWVRNISVGDEPLDPETIPYNVSGYHQKPLKLKDRYVYARIKNIGALKSNLEAKVRFYVVLDDPGTIFSYPEHFKPNGNVAAGSKGVALLGEVTINENTINPGQSKVVKVPWLATTSSANSIYDTNILVEVTPHDGPFFDTEKKGKLLSYNNNISRKKIIFGDTVEITSDTGQKLNNILIPSTAITTPVTTSFKATMRDSDAFSTELAELKVKVEYLGGTFEELTYKHNGSWGFDNPPTNGWIVLNPPLMEPFGTVNLATGNQFEISFNGQFIVNGTVDKIKITGSFKDTAGQTIMKDALVDVSIQTISNTNPTYVPTERNDVYFFTEYNKLQLQTSAESYGPDSSTPTTKFNLTSKHKASSNCKAFALFDGQIVVQKTTDPLLINIILKPGNQGVIDFLNIKYIIYRGILKSSVIDSVDPMKIAPEGTNAFIDSLWQTQRSLNEAIENADQSDGITPGSILDEPSAKALGIHFVANTTSVDEIQKTDTDSFDNIFYDRTNQFTFPLVSKGKEIGVFDKNSIGMDIVLHQMGQQTSFGDVRGDKLSVIHTASAGSTPLDRLQYNAKRSKVLGYMDIAAFYGVHYFTGVKAISSTNTTDLKKENALYDDLLDQFANKRRVYLDIRNENDYALNYYNNYTDTNGFNIELSFDPTNNPSPASFGSHGWPVHIIENSQFAGGNNTGSNTVKINFPKGNNGRPLLYLPFAYRSAEFPKLPVKSRKFQEVTFSGTANYSDTLEFATPNRSGLSATNSVASYIKLAYNSRYDSAHVPANSVEVWHKESLDHLFPIRFTVPLDTSDTIVFGSGIHSHYCEATDMSFNADIGIAFETNRVFLFAVPEDIHQQSSENLKLYKRILGGTSSKDSFFDVLSYGFPNMKLIKQELVIGGNSKYMLSYNDFESIEKDNIDRHNFHCLGITRSEYDALTNAADNLGLDDQLHFQTIVVKSNQVLADDNNVGYKIYQLSVAGIDINGDYKISPFEISVYSRDGVLLCSSDFAQAENSTALNEYCIKFDGKQSGYDQNTRVGSVIKRLSLFKNVNGSIKRSWEVYNADGTQMHYTGTESTNFGVALTAADPILLPVGIRVIRLDCKSLPVETFGSIEYVRFVSFYNGRFIEGYISSFAFHSSSINRVLTTKDITDDELFDAMTNDMKQDVHMARRLLLDSTVTPGQLPDTNFENLVTYLENQLDPQAFDSFVQIYNNKSLIERSIWMNNIRNGNQIFGFHFDSYYDTNKGFRIDVPGTLDRFVNLIGSSIPYNDPLFTFVPFHAQWCGLTGVVSGYNFTIENYTQNNFVNLLGNVFGDSGYTMRRETQGEFADAISDLTNLRDFLNGVTVNGLTIASDDGVLNTPEAMWLKKPSHSANYDGNDFFDSINTLLTIWTGTWNEPKNPGHLESDFRCGYIGIDCSMGFVNSNNVLSVMIHELNVSHHRVLKLADDTHSNTSSVSYIENDVSQSKLVSETSWEYVRSFDFQAFNAHGFYPIQNYVSSQQEPLGSSNYSATKNICDFLQRNPSLGVIYAKLIIDKLKSL